MAGSKTGRGLACYCAFVFFEFMQSLYITYSKFKKPECLIHICIALYSFQMAPTSIILPAPYKKPVR